jgi:hypothetical protein
MKPILILLLCLIPAASAYTDIGDNLIEPRFYDGNLLIYNEGYVPYSIFADDNYLGTINHEQGMYVNESCNYSLYANYDEIRDITDVAEIEKKFNQWWLVVLVVLVFLIIGIKVYRGVKR